jgi:Ulp1 family protease
MLWLSRNCRQKESPEHFFTSHFYTKLTEKGGGVEHVSNWLRRRFSIFEKRIMYFPIHLDNHWSLCVAYNPSVVRETPTNCRYTANSGVPIILHLDSLKLHNSSKIADNIRNLFSYEWQRQFPSVKFKFDKINYPVVCPTGEFFVLCFINILYLFYTNEAIFLFYSA